MGCKFNDLCVKYWYACSAHAISLYLIKQSAWIDYSVLIIWLTCHLWNKAELTNILIKTIYLAVHGWIIFYAICGFMNMSPSFICQKLKLYSECCTLERWASVVIPLFTLNCSIRWFVRFCTRKNVTQTGLAC